MRNCLLGTFWATKIFSYAVLNKFDENLTPLCLPVESMKLIGVALSLDAINF